MAMAANVIWAIPKNSRTHPHRKREVILLFLSDSINFGLHDLLFKFFEWRRCEQGNTPVKNRVRLAECAFLSSGVPLTAAGSGTPQ